MARKLKTYRTSVGFFDLAIAAPSMKAALAAWGAKSNLFHQGFASEVDDSDIIAATMAKPGLVLRRPVGSNGPFREHAELPGHLPASKAKGGADKSRARPVRRPAREIDDKAARKAALAFQNQEEQRESRRRKQEAALAKQLKRREQAVAKAQAAVDAARQDHEARMRVIEKARDALDKRSAAEDQRWEKQKKKLETALRRARD
jgi:colicin import membrane protein